MVAEAQYTKKRMTPSLKKHIGKVYRPYYMAFAVLSILVCIGLLVCASALKEYDSSLKDQLFHIWVAIPILVPALFGIGVYITKNRKVVIIFLILSLIVMVMCASATMMTGLRYWLDGWYATRERLDTKGKCTELNGLCACSGISKMPLNVKTCSKMKTATNFLIGEIVISTLGFIFSLAGIFLAFMTICCGPWQFIDDYEKENDIDRNPNVEFVHAQRLKSETLNVNQGFDE
eukprot:gene11845-13076_t